MQQLFKRMLSVLLAVAVLLSLTVTAFAADDGADALFAKMPADRRPPPGMVADHLWALSHGVVELFSRGKPGSRSPMIPAYCCAISPSRPTLRVGGNH